VGLWIGAALFAVVGLVGLCASEDQLRSLGWGIAFVYVIAGAGRGVFETTNRAAMVDFFPGEHAAAAFSNLNTWVGFSFTFGFIVFEFISQTAMGAIILLAAVLSSFATWRAYSIWYSEGGRRSQQALVADDSHGVQLHLDGDVKDGDGLGQHGSSMEPEIGLVEMNGMMLE